MYFLASDIFGGVPLMGATSALCDVTKVSELFGGFGERSRFTKNGFEKKRKVQKNRLVEVQAEQMNIFSVLLLLL